MLWDPDLSAGGKRTWGGPSGKTGVAISKCFRLAGPHLVFFFRFGGVWHGITAASGACAVFFVLTVAFKKAGRKQLSVRTQLNLWPDDRCFHPAIQAGAELDTNIRGENCHGGRLEKASGAISVEKTNAKVKRSEK